MRPRFISIGWCVLLFLCSSAIAHAQGDPTPPTLALTELRQKAIELDKKTIRLRFHYRDVISQLDAERYYVMLNDKDGQSIWVEFPREGLTAFKKMPENDKYSSTHALYVFGAVRTPASTNRPSYFFTGTWISPVILDVFGTNISKNISGGIKYVW